MIKMMRSKKGFTLIELLVVISIIGILAGLTLASFSGAQKQARDTTRKSDLNQYRIALETYAAGNNQKYPGYGTGDVGVIADTYLYPNTLTAYMSAGPADPVSSGNYLNNYKYRGNGGAAGCGVNGCPISTQYVLYCRLETGGYWEICSNGKAGRVDDTLVPVSSNCTIP